jgi:UDP-N-acetylmuramoylalanine--D-glutamate ligase
MPEVTQIPIVLPDYENLAGQQVVLVGLGRRTNVSLARFLVKRGARVRVSERKLASEVADELALVADLPIELRLGGHADDHVEDADVVFVTPGVPRELPMLEHARQRGVPISSEIELLFALARAPIVGITGSAGKTTTTTLVGEMLQSGDRPVYVGGNIGVPLIESVDDIGPNSWIVLELSSYQLENLRRSPRVGAILNVTPNHLDRHPTFVHYRESKLNIVRHGDSNSVAVLGADDPVAAGLAERCPGEVRRFSAIHDVERGAYLAEMTLRIRDDVDAPICDIGDLRVPGLHNVRNMLAAATVSRSVGIKVEAISAVAINFAGVEHRLEHVREMGGISFLNDSIATSPERTVAALRALRQPVILIAGGRSKHLPMAELASEMAARARAVVTLGEMAEEIEDAIASNGVTNLTVLRATSLEAAVREARNLAQPGDIVLLSPAGTSFDMFRDFEDRGRAFKTSVNRLDDEES